MGLRGSESFFPESRRGPRGLAGDNTRAPVNTAEQALRSLPSQMPPGRALAATWNRLLLAIWGTPRCGRDQTSQTTFKLAWEGCLNIRVLPLLCQDSGQISKLWVHSLVVRALRTWKERSKAGEFGGCGYEQSCRNCERAVLALQRRKGVGLLTFCWLVERGITPAAGQYLTMPNHLCDLLAGLEDGVHPLCESLRMQLGRCCVHLVHVAFQAGTFGLWQLVCAGAPGSTRQIPCLGWPFVRLHDCWWRRHEGECLVRRRPAAAG